MDFHRVDFGHLAQSKVHGTGVLRHVAGPALHLTKLHAQRGVHFHLCAVCVAVAGDALQVKGHKVAALGLVGLQSEAWRRKIQSVQQCGHPKVHPPVAVEVGARSPA